MQLLRKLGRKKNYKKFSFIKELEHGVCQKPIPYSF